MCSLDVVPTSTAKGLPIWGQAQLEVCSLDVVPTSTAKGLSIWSQAQLKLCSLDVVPIYLGSGSAEGVFTRCSSYLPGVRLS